MSSYVITRTGLGGHGDRLHQALLDAGVPVLTVQEGSAPDTMLVVVPDAVTQAMVEAVALGGSFDPTAPMPSEAQGQQDHDSLVAVRDTLQNWLGDFQTIQAHCLATHAHMQTIANTANPTVANLASLVATVNALKTVAADLDTTIQDLNTLLVDVSQLAKGVLALAHRTLP